MIGICVQIGLPDELKGCTGAWCIDAGTAGTGNQSVFESDTVVGCVRLCEAFTPRFAKVPYVRWSEDIEKQCPDRMEDSRRITRPLAGTLRFSPPGLRD